MSHRQMRNLQSSQQSVVYSIEVEDDEESPLRKCPQYYKQHYPGMFIEDVANHILPYRETARKDFRIYLTPSDDKHTRELVAAALDREEYNYDLMSAVRTFFHDCVSSIMEFEESAYEIVFYSQPDDGKVVTFKLAPMHPCTLIRRKGKVEQYVPAQVAQIYNLQQFIPLTPEHVFAFKAPVNLQTKLHHTMEDLGYLSENLLFPALLQKANRTSKSHPLDYDAFSYAEKRAVADAVKYIGWNARGHFQEQALEFYQLRQALLFERFILELRQSILDKLNEAIQYAGNVIGFSGQMQVEGLPTLTEIEDAQKHLFVGDLPFKSLEPLKPY